VTRRQEKIINNTRNHYMRALREADIDIAKEFKFNKRHARGIFCVVESFLAMSIYSNFKNKSVINLETHIDIFNIAKIKIYYRDLDY
jgi:hypothetical protein